MIGADQVTVIAKIATPDRLDRAAEQGIDVAEVEAAPRRAGRRGTPPGRTPSRDYLRQLDPDGPEPDPTDERS